MLMVLGCKVASLLIYVVWRFLADGAPILVEVVVAVRLLANVDAQSHVADGESRHKLST